LEITIQYLYCDMKEYEVASNASLLQLKLAIVHIPGSDSVLQNVSGLLTVLRQSNLKFQHVLF
jgi:hypothetical protein